MSLQVIHKKQKKLSTQLRLVFNLTDYQVGPIAIVHVNRTLFLERVTHDKAMLFVCPHSLKINMEGQWKPQCKYLFVSTL